jgi:WD40 repeat protein
MFASQQSPYLRAPSSSAHIPLIIRRCEDLICLTKVVSACFLYAFENRCDCASSSDPTHAHWRVNYNVNTDHRIVGFFDFALVNLHFGKQIFDGVIYTGSSDNTARAFSIDGRSAKTVFRCHEKTVTCIKVIDQLGIVLTVLVNASSNTIFIVITQRI